MSWLEMMAPRALLGRFIGKIFNGVDKVKLLPKDRKSALFYSQFINPGDLCFDVGANIGNRTNVFLGLGAKVVAVEPQRACCQILSQKFGHISRFNLVEKALGASEGELEMMIANVNTISSLSRDWVNSVKASGRFLGYTWDEKEIVRVTTLDRLIDRFGTPRFVKIDVEGYEYEVVMGLTRTVRFLSLEYTPEFFDCITKCIKHLEGLGHISLNFSFGESMEMAFSDWVPTEVLLKRLEEYEDDISVFGDVYVAFEEAEIE